MWPWAGSSDRPRALRAAAAGLAACVLVAGVPGAAAAQAGGTVSQQRALERAFPGPSEVERRTAYLDSADLSRARELAGSRVEIEQTVVTHYVGARGDSALGVAYFDAHRVRTLPEVLMILVTPEGRVGRVEVLKFSEPPDYRPPEGWLDEFRGRELSPELARGRGIVNITGATLTSRSVTRAVRRALALHAVIDPLGRGGTPEPGGSGSDTAGPDAAGPGAGDGAAVGPREGGLRAADPGTGQGSRP